ncbi:MAG: hypothetical protein E6H66_02320 [Betaproteobacteria bacterium]|nr:MAG: hypothetical protein E6H66_02320 [Betaproteobacteria bacterium]
MGKVQGEGDYESAKRFDDDEAAFVKSGRVDQAARDAVPKSQAEADEMKNAEEKGKSRSKGEDPTPKGKDSTTAAPDSSAQKPPANPRDR